MSLNKWRFKWYCLFTMIECDRSDSITLLNAVENRFYEWRTFSVSLTMKNNLGDLTIRTWNYQRVFTLEPVAFVFEQKRADANSEANSSIVETCWIHLVMSDLFFLYFTNSGQLIIWRLQFSKSGISDLTFNTVWSKLHRLHLSHKHSSVSFSQTDNFSNSSRLICQFLMYLFLAKADIIMSSLLQTLHWAYSISRFEAWRKFLQNFFLILRRQLFETSSLFSDWRISLNSLNNRSHGLLRMRARICSSLPWIRYESRTRWANSDWLVRNKWNLSTKLLSLTTVDVLFFFAKSAFMMFLAVVECIPALTNSGTGCSSSWLSRKFDQDEGTFPIPIWHNCLRNNTKSFGAFWSNGLNNAAIFFQNGEQTSIVSTRWTFSALLRLF